MIEGGQLVFTREAVREVDRTAVERYTIPSMVLMENAAIHAAGVALEMVAAQREPRVLIVCGPGNNGGDGLAMARHLSNAGARVEVVLSGAGDRLRGDAGTNLGIVLAMGLPVLEPGHDGAAAVLRERAVSPCPHLIVDAILGTGAVKTVRGPMMELIEEVNRIGAHGAPILAVDVPSGLDADTGLPLGAAVRATRTVTFVGIKQGFLNTAAAAYTGRVVVAGIGAPRQLVERLGKQVQV